MQSSVSVSMWFMWIITGLSESYKVLHKISNKELQSKEKFHFKTLTRNQSESFSLNLFCQLCKPFVFEANIFKLHSPLYTFLSSRAWLSQLDFYERPNSHKDRTEPDGGRKWLMAYAPTGAKGETTTNSHKPE